MDFPSGMNRYGIPAFTGAIPPGLTKILFVDYGNGSDSISEKSNSPTNPYKTIEYAYSKLITNKNEGLALMGNTTHSLAAMLTTAKNRVHMFGYDPGGRMYGQNAKVSLGVTTAATDIGTISNTGVRNSFRNIKFMNSNTVAEGIYCFVEGGEYTVIDGCEIYKSTDLDVTGASELVMNGDSCQVLRSTIGSLADETSGAIIRANIRLTGGLAGAGLKARDVVFKDCMVWRKAGHVNNRLVYGANATDVERLLLFKNCTFINNILSTATPAKAVGFGAAQTEGVVLLQDCASVDCTLMAEAAVGIYVAGAVPTFATTGVSVAA